MRVAGDMPCRPPLHRQKLLPQPRPKVRARPRLKASARRPRAASIRIQADARPLPQWQRGTSHSGILCRNAPFPRPAARLPIKS